MDQLISGDVSYYVFTSDTNSVDFKSGDVCFRRSRDTFSVDKHNYQTNINVELWFYRHSCERNRTKSNRCNISMEECRIWFDFLKKLFPFEYEFSICEEDKDMYYMRIFIPKANRLQYLFVMTAIRSVYERANAFAMVDVFNLIKHELVTTENLMDVFKVIMTAIGYNSGQTLFGTGFFIPFRSVSSYVEILDKTNFSYIQSIDTASTSSSKLIGLGVNSVYKNSNIGVYEDLFNKEKIIERYKMCYRPIIEYHKKQNTLPRDFNYV